jgi:hydroxymethylbilane synthase
VCLPPAGQGAIGIELREDDDELRDFLLVLNHPETKLEVEAERSFIKKLGGGCRAAVGVLGRVNGGGLLLRAIVGVPGRRPIRMEIEGRSEDSINLGEELAERMLGKIGVGIHFRNGRGNV